MKEEGGGIAHSRELDQTPTWAVATVCAVIVLISILLEKVLDQLGEVMGQIQKPASSLILHCGLFGFSFSDSIGFFFLHNSLQRDSLVYLVKEKHIKLFSFHSHKGLVFGPGAILMSGIHYMIGKCNGS